MLNQPESMPSKYEDKDRFIHIDLKRKGGYVVVPKSIYSGCAPDKPKCKKCFQKNGICLYKNLIYELMNDFPVATLDFNNIQHEIKQDIQKMFRLTPPPENPVEIKMMMPDDEIEDENTDGLYYGRTIDEWKEFIDTLGSLASAPHDDWVIVCMCLYNIFEKHSERDNLIHDFSSLCREKYDRRVVNDKIKSFNDQREHKVKFNRLRELCDQYGIDTSMFQWKVKENTDIQKLLEYRDCEYFVCDFIKGLQNKKNPWKVSDLAKFVKDNMHKVIFLKYGETKNVYLKKSIEEFCIFSRDLAHKQLNFFYEHVKIGRAHV
jgi:hypothetical protein